jgi:hypothetical protein
MIDVDGEKKHRNNSEGKPIHHTDEGIRNFHKWFGDSKAVDKHGRPQVHYHGTGADINKFSDVPIWLSKSPHLANAYAGHRGAYNKKASPNVIPLYAKTKSHFDADKLPNSVTVNRFYSELHNQSNKPEHTEELNAHRISTIQAGKEEGSGPQYSKKDFWHRSSELFGSKGHDAINKSLHLAGFDSISHTESGDDTIGLLHPSQVKSAVGNSGEFSSGSHKITEMKEF